VFLSFLLPAMDSKEQGRTR